MFRNASKLQRYKGLEFQLRLIQNRRNHVNRLYSTEIKNPSPKQTEPSANKKPASTGFGATVGAIALLTGAVVSYAKYDDEFREWMDKQIPNFSSFVGIVFQEEKTFSDRLGAIPSYFMSFFGDSPSSSGVEKPAKEPVRVHTPVVKEEVVPYIAPRPAFSVLLEETPPGPCNPHSDHPYQEIRAIYPYSDNIETLTPAPSEEKGNTSDKIQPQEAVDLEVQIGRAAKISVECYQNAINIIRELSQRIVEMLDAEPNRLGPDVWPTINRLSKERAILLHRANENAAKAKVLVEELNRLDNQERIPAPDPVKAQATKNAQRVLNDIEQARRQVERELNDTSLGRNAWERVLVGREKWRDEILLLAPDATLDEKTLRIIEDELAQFVLHAYINIQYYQKELALLEMGAEKLLTDAVEAAHKGNVQPLIQVSVSDKIAEERRKIDLEFARKALELRTNCAKEIRLQLKANSEIQLDHLTESLRLLEAEELREHNRRLGEALAAETAAYRLELASIVGRIRGIDEGLQEHAQVDKRAHQAQDLWAACQIFLRQVEMATNSGQLSPLESIVRTIDSQAGDSDELVKAVIKGIPNEAISRGIYSTSVLRERFLKVEKVARNLGAVGSEGGSLANMFLSWIQGNLLIENKSPLSLEERKDEPIRVDLLSNYDLLSRARYWVLRGDLTQALKYMNLLQGSARCIAEDWMKEVRLHLECRQAALALVSHATALGMMYS